MTQSKKTDFLRETIENLYQKEGRSKAYISKLILVDRNTLSKKIEEWGLIKADKRHLTPSNQKFLNKHKKTIIDLLDSDVSISDIANQIGKTRSSLLKTFIKNNRELLHHYNMHNERKRKRTQERISSCKENSSRNYTIEDMRGEVWKEILGFDNYYVSNMGRFKKYAKRYKSYYLMNVAYNKISGYGYIRLVNSKGENKNLSAARVVAHTFVPGYCEEKNTVDHIDGDKANNKATNLEWVSQGENNLRAYNNGKKPHRGYSKRGKFKKIILDNKYEFKTIRSLAKFMNVSETQVCRYIDGKSKTKHTFKILY